MTIIRCSDFWTGIMRGIERKQRLTVSSLPLSHHITSIMMEVAGVELPPHSENTQVIDFAKRRKRQNRYFRRFEVHGGYTEPESVTPSNIATTEVGP